MAYFKWVLSETGTAARTSEFTVADIFAFHEVQQAVVSAKYDLSAHPEVNSWYQKVLAIDTVREMQDEFLAFAAALQASLENS